MNTISLKRLQTRIVLLLALGGAAGVQCPSLRAYSVPQTCIVGLPPYVPYSIVFTNNYPKSSHTWALLKAIHLFYEGTPRYPEQAKIAKRYLLPMMLGNMWNDTWGTSDYAGTQVLDYYNPSPSSEHNHGYGLAVEGLMYKNSTESFANHAFYGYGNAAEHAQFRYDYAKRIMAGRWGEDWRDRMAGWVVDTTGGQNDPNDGNWAHGADVINGLKCFGNGQTPSSALWDLRNNFSQSQMVFPELECESEPNLSRIFVPKYEVFAEAPEWLDNHYGNAEDIEAYMGYDGQGNAIYANWTTDAGDLGGCVSILFFTGVGSREHSFFQLGWAIHLVQDGTLTPHTTDDSFDYYNAFDHQEMEGLIGKIISEPLRYGPICIPAALPALTQSEFQDLYPWPLPNPCGGYSLTNPTVYFRPNWASGYLARDPREGVAHAYIRNTTEILTNYAPWLISDCVDIERQNDEKDVEDVGFLNVLQLDTCVKVTAGLIHHFLNDVGLWEGELQDGVNGPFTDPQLPYELLGDVTVPVGRTLTLGPGLRVKFNPGRKITALGTLTVDGASAPVRLVSSSDPNRAVVIRSRLVLSNGGELKLP